MSGANPLPSAATPAAPARLPLRVVCVVKALADAGADNLQAVKKFALESGLMYETREYNSWKYNHDCDYITSLPAFHLYVSGFHRATFYPDTRPLQIILDARREFVAAEARRAAKAKEKPVRKFFAWLLATLRGLGKRQSALERAQAERVAALQRASVDRPMRWSGGTIRTADWE